MNDHADILKLLSAYCGGDLNPADQARVEEHLVSCAVCRAELADLRSALRLIRTTPEVEPPPWLTGRIMARLREEQQQQRSWLQRLFFPLRIKLPLEALAVLMVCVTGYYLSRTPEPEMKGAIPQLEVPAAPRSAHIPAAGREPGSPAAVRPESVVPGNEPRQASKPAAPAQSPVSAAPPAFAPAPPSFTEERLAPAAGAGVESQNNAPAAELAGKSRDSVMKMKKAAPAREMQRRESVAPMQAERSTSDGAPAGAAYPQVTVRLSLTDAASAKQSVRKAIMISGGGVVELEQAPAERKLKARIPAERFSELMEQLGRLGRIVVRPAAPDATGLVEVVIEW